MTELPDGWAMAKLGEITSDAAQHIPAQDEWFTYIDIGSIDRETKRIATPQVLLGKDAPSRARKKVVQGDTLVSMTRPNLNAVAQVPAELDGQIASTGFDVLRPSNGIDPRWIGYLVRTEDFVNTMADLVQGALYPAVRSKDIRSYEAPIAPAKEQARIADQLDTLLARVNACNDHLDAIPGILKRFRQAVLNATQAEDLSIEDYGGETTDVWQSTTVGEVLVGKPRNGYSPKSVSYETPVKSLTLSATTTGRFLPQHTKFIDEHIPEDSHLWLECGDILIQRANTLDYVGVSAIFEGPSKTFIYPDLMMKCRPKESVRGKFLLYALSTDSTRQYFRNNATGTAGNMPKINQQTVMSAPILVPDLETQDKIIRRADLLIGAADRIEARYTAMRAQAQRLAPQVLAKAFRGELVEQDPKDEPASVLLQRLAATASAKVPSSRGRPRAQPQVPATSPAPQAPAPIDWHTLPNNGWAAHAAAQDQAITACLTAVLKAWGQPMPERGARLATLLCQQPDVFTTALPAAQGKEWLRLVGDEAKPLPAQVARLQPTSSSPWGQAIKRMRARGDLVEAGSADDTTWSLGPGASAIVTAGWPDGRAAFVVAYLRTHGVASILPALAPADQALVHVRAA